MIGYKLSQPLMGEEFGINFGSGFVLVITYIPSVVRSPTIKLSGMTNKRKSGFICNCSIEISLDSGQIFTTGGTIYPGSGVEVGFGDGDVVIDGNTLTVSDFLREAGSDFCRYGEEVLVIRKEVVDVFPGAGSVGTATFTVGVTSEVWLHAANMLINSMIMKNLLRMLYILWNNSMQ
jgi:hypothetical protein